MKELALHIAAAAPQYVRREEVPAEVLEREKDIERTKLREQKKPEAMIEKILTGKLEKYFEVSCLLDQPWVKDDKKKIHEVVTEAIAKIGENISVRRFARFVVGEGIEKKKEDLAAEVAKTVAGSAGGSPPAPSGGGAPAVPRTSAFPGFLWTAHGHVVIDPAPSGGVQVRVRASPAPLPAHPAQAVR